MEVSACAVQFAFSIFGPCSYVSVPQGDVVSFLADRTNLLGAQHAC